MEDFLKKLTGSGNRGMIYFYLGATALIGAEIAILFFVMPGYFSSLREKMAFSEVRREEVAAYDKSLKMLSTLDQSQIDSYLGKLLLALPDEKKTSGIISGMTALASQSGVVVTGLEFSPGFVATNSGQTIEATSQDRVVDSALNVRAIPAALTISASPVSLINFLKKLSEASQLIGVSAVNYESSGIGQIKAVISIQIYYQPRDISRFSWRGLRGVSGEDIGFVQTLPGEDLFVLQGQSGKITP